MNHRFAGFMTGLHTREGRREGAFTAVSLLCLAGAFALALYYIWGPGRVEFHSDCTDTILWAQASYESGRIFSPTFYYACLLPFGGYLLMLPFIGLTGVSMTTHALGMSLFLCAFAASMLWLFRAMRWSRNAAALGAAAVLLAVQLSPKLREMFYGHIIYYSLGILFLCVGLALLFRVRDRAEEEAARGGRQWLGRLTVLIAWCALCSTDGITALTLFTVPALFAVLAERFFDTDTSLFGAGNRRAWFIAFAMLTGVLLGNVLGRLAVGPMTAAYADQFSAFSPADTWAANLAKFPEHWMSLLGVSAQGGGALASAGGISDALRIGFAVLLLALPAAALFLYKRLDDYASRIVVLAHWAVTALILFGYVFGQLSWANWRLCPIVVTSLLVCLVFIRRLFKNKRFQRFGMALVLPVVAVLALGAVQAARLPADPGTDSPYYRVGKYLELNGLTYGYASFWNANVVTVVTDSRVQVRDIWITKNAYGPRQYQCDARWYAGRYSQDAYFVLLTNAEYADAMANGNPILSGSVRILRFESYTILIYGMNIFGV